MEYKSTKREGERTNRRMSKSKSRSKSKKKNWNIAGLSKRGEQFWEYVRKFEVVGLVETWVEEWNWEKIEKKLPKE
jgi:hypothetical protein